MKNSISVFYITASLPAGSLVGCNTDTAKPEPGPPDFPAVLQPDPSEKLVFKADAAGFQIYACDSIAPGQYAWKLKMPEADLFDEKGNKIATHFGGPTWKSAIAGDNSQVVGVLMDGKPKGKFDSPSAGAIPWLLVTGKSDGPGMFAGVDLIQRLATNGGRAPEGCCTGPNGCQEIRVPYTATYYFYSSSPVK